jgi:hypothetical protein
MAYVGAIGHRHEHVILFHRNVTISKFERDTEWQESWKKSAQIANADIRGRVDDKMTRHGVYPPPQLLEDTQKVTRDPARVHFTVPLSQTEYTVIGVHAPNPNKAVSGVNLADAYAKSVFAAFNRKADIIIGDFNLSAQNPGCQTFTEVTRNAGPTTLGESWRRTSRHDRAYLAGNVAARFELTAPPKDPTTGYEVSDHHILALLDVQKPNRRARRARLAGPAHHNLVPLDVQERGVGQKRGQKREFELLRSENEGLTCVRCNNQHGDKTSTWFGRWHQCDDCQRTYCNTCASALNVVSACSRSRKCDCGEQTTLIN